MLPAVGATHTTSAWPLDALTDASHVDSNQLQMAELVLDDLEAGRPLLESPPAAGVVTPRTADDDAEPPVAE